MFYHGTSSNLKIGKKILPPVATGVVSEDTRKIRLDKVFFTSDKGYALIYARKACLKFGGHPVVYKVIPGENDEIECVNDTPGCTVFCTYMLDVID